MTGIVRLVSLVQPKTTRLTMGRRFHELGLDDGMSYRMDMMDRDNVAENLIHVAVEIGAIPYRERYERRM